MKNRNFRTLLLLALLLHSACFSAEETSKYIRDLGSKDSIAKTKAIIMLGNNGDLGAIIPLVNIMKNDPALDLKRQAVIALGKIGDESIVPPMIGVLRTTAEAALVREIIKVLSNFKRGDVEEALLRFITSDNPIIRRETILAMTAIKADGLSTAVKEALGDMSSDVRIAAVNFFAAVKSTAALESILNLMTR